MASGHIVFATDEKMSRGNICSIAVLEWAFGAGFLFFHGEMDADCPSAQQEELGLQPEFHLKAE